MTSIAAFILGAFISLPALAFRLDPMVAELAPSGNGSSKVFRVENNGQERIAVQLKVTRREIDAKGAETRRDSKDFSIFPEQLSLGPNDTRNVRVTYNGTKDVASEVSYRLIATQLPVDFKAEKKQAQLNFLFQYVASLYVTPPQALAKLEVRKIEAVGPKKLIITIANIGTGHRLMKDVKLKLVTEAGETIHLQESSYKSWPGENLLAGAVRDFELETTANLPAKSKIKADLLIETQP